MSMYTGRYTLDNRIGTAAASSPSGPWTRLGHLLYIDARQAGFSFNRMERDEDVTERLRSSTPRISIPSSTGPISSACCCASWRPIRSAGGRWSSSARATAACGPRSCCTSC